MPDDVAHYERFLADHGWLAESGFCWTVVEPVTAPLGVADVTSRLGIEVRPLDPAELSGDAYVDSGRFGRIVRAGAVDGRVVLLEENGFQGVRPEVLRWLSDGARAWSLFWNVERDNHLCYAVYGSVVTELEVSGPGHRWGKDPAALDEELQVLPDNTDADEFEDWRPAAMAVVERCSGVRLNDDWLDQVGLYTISREHPPDPRPPGGLGFSDPDLDARLRLAPPALQQAVIIDLLADLAERFDLTDEPVIRQVLDGLPDLLAHYDETLMRDFVVLAQDLGFDCRVERAGDAGAFGPAWHRLQAANAFHAVLVSAAYGDRLDAVRSACQALGDDWPAVRTALRRRLR